MTTLANMASPARLPFASLGGGRLRNMANIKNKQNALASTAPSALKRHAPAEFDHVDSENIDPLIFSSPVKKGRPFDFDAIKSNEAPLFAPVPPRSAQYVERAQVAGQKRKVDDAEDATTPAAGIKRRTEPFSAPVPAGRSPKSKRIGILSRRRMTTSSFTRVNPPSASAVESTGGLPFSIDAALAASVPKYKSKLKGSHGKGWQFDIHEDAPGDEKKHKIQHELNIMEYSCDTLEISDDESNSLKGDKDNKENIPPVDGPAGMISTTQVTPTRRDVMTDEAREPLGNLQAKDFYADGCDASSFIIVAAEDSSGQIVDKLSAAVNPQESSLLPSSRTNAVTEAQNGWEDVMARFATKTTTAATGADMGTGDENSKQATDIQIWESESAKGDDDADIKASETDGVNPQSLSA